MKKRAIYWFRNDLRLSDNPALVRALKESDELVPVFVFDERWWTEDRWGQRKTGAWRTQFLLESVAELREALRALGSGLVVAKGNTPEVLAALADELACTTVYAQAEHTSEELALEAEVAAVLPLHLEEGMTLFHPEDLPMELADLPDIFSQFRRKAEKYSDVRALLAAPETIPGPEVPESALPAMEDFGYERPVFDPRAVLPFKGGAAAAHERLNHYFWHTRQLGTYKETRNGLLGADYSSKFSPWLANGCISPREIFFEVKRFEAEFGESESSYWLIFELIWRDYFRFVAMKYGNRIFHEKGIKAQAPSRRQDRRVYERWCEGLTKNEFVNANMHELVATGFMSNRGRQNVASYLVHDLGIDWRLGASFFEHHLIDYDPASNYGNWIYLAGVGNDPRESRKFNTARQAEMYDGSGNYRKVWAEPAPSKTA